MVQVGTEGGFLPGVVNDGSGGFTTGLPIHPNGIPAPYLPGSTTDVNPDGPFNLLLAPAERADVLIDFTGLAGKSFILYNDAPAPFPGGDPRNDYFTGDPDFTAPANNVFGLSGGAPSTQAGHGPNTRTIMKIVVGHRRWRAPWLTLIPLPPPCKGTSFPAISRPCSLASTPIPRNSPSIRLRLRPRGWRKRRQLTLNEDFDEFGRLIQTIGTTTQNGFNNQGLPTWGIGYIDGVTENPNAGAYRDLGYL